MTLEEAEEALQRVLEYYEYYTENKDDPTRPIYSPEEAYEKCIRRWPDALFDCYTFPKVICSFICTVTGQLQICYLSFQYGEQYVLRKVRDANKNDKVLYAISAPSAAEFSDSEDEGDGQDGAGAGEASADGGDADEEGDGEEEDGGVINIPDPTEAGDDDDSTVNPEGDTIEVIMNTFLSINSPVTVHLLIKQVQEDLEVMPLDEAGQAAVEAEFLANSSMLAMVEEVQDMEVAGKYPGDPLGIGEGDISCN